MDRVTNPKLVDVVIPVHNRLEHTQQTINSLLKNTNHELFNLYIVDDFSDDPKMREYLEELAYVYPVFFNPTNIGPGATRNWMCDWITRKGLRSEYLYHSDNDVYFKPRWLEILIAIYNEFYEDILLLGGGCHPYLQSKDYFYPQSHLDCKVGIKDAVSGYSQLMKWEVWDQYGPFDETMRGAEKKIMGSEDWAFCQKIVKDEFLVGSVEPEVVVATGKTNTYGEPSTGSETFKEQEGIKIK